MKISNLIPASQRDRLHFNAFLIFLSNAILAVTGAIFWLINAHMFSTQNVGLATAMISLVSTISNFSMLGFNNLFLRFLPRHINRSQLLNVGFLITGLASLILSIAVFFLVPAFAPRLHLFANTGGDFVLLAVFVVTTTLNLLTNSVFIALRVPGIMLVINLIFGALRILLIFAFTKNSPIPIYLVYLMATVVAAVLSILYLIAKRGYSLTAIPNKNTLNSLKSFTANSYVVSILGGLPAMLLPIILTEKLGANNSAFYFMASTTAGFLTILPVAIGQSLTVEGAYDEAALSRYVKRASRTMLAIMIPVVTVTIIIAYYIMLIFGHSYADHSTVLMRILALSGLLTTVNYIAISILNIKKKLGVQIIVNTVDAVIVIGGVIIFAHNLTDVGIIWLVGEVANAGLFSWFAYRASHLTISTSSTA